jgi:hypothetical protein
VAVVAILAIASIRPAGTEQRAFTGDNFRPSLVLGRDGAPRLAQWLCACPSWRAGHILGVWVVET